jgi:hypothetical protein
MPRSSHLVIGIVTVNLKSQVTNKSFPRAEQVQGTARLRQEVNDVEVIDVADEGRQQVGSVTNNM